MLRDGEKIIVFSGQFSVDGSNDNDNVILKLSINNIRKALSNALLGFCPRKYLQRGISVASLKSQNGGNVFAIRGQVIFVSDEMSTVKLSNHDSSSDNNTTWNKYILDSEESAYIRMFIENHKTSQNDRSGVDESDISEILDDLNCSPQIKKIIMGDGKSIDYNYLSANEVQELQVMKEKIQFEIQRRFNQQRVNQMSEVSFNSF